MPTAQTVSRRSKRLWSIKYLWRKLFLRSSFVFCCKGIPEKKLTENSEVDFVCRHGPDIVTGRAHVGSSVLSSYIVNFHDGTSCNSTGAVVTALLKPKKTASFRLTSKLKDSPQTLKKNLAFQFLSWYTVLNYAKMSKNSFSRNFPERWNI